jgi:hypothetical protein
LNRYPLIDNPKPFFLLLLLFHHYSSLSIDS